MKLSSIVGHILELCSLIEVSSTPVDNIVWSFFKQRKYLGSRDRAKIRASVYGMVREWRYIETISQKYFESHSLVFPSSNNKERFLPLYLTHTVLILKFSVEELVTNLMAMWNANFPSNDLRLFLSWVVENADTVKNSPNPVDRLGIQYSYPGWMVKKFLSQYGDETESVLRALNMMGGTTLRVNRIKISRNECQQRLKEEGIDAVPTNYSPDGLIVSTHFDRMASASFKEGLYDFQDEGSQLISHIAKPGANQLVIDACSGGGGKTLHMAEMMQESGKIIALDINMERMKGLAARIERTHIQNVEKHTIDSLNRLEYREKADLVLVDAPCSGVGRIRRSPDIKRRLKESQVDYYPAKQKEILISNSEFVKPGGCLVYSTCSLFQSENEDVVNAFLEMRKEFTLILPVDRMKELNVLPDDDKFIRILPHRYPTDGFFIAVMQRELKKFAC